MSYNVRVVSANVGTGAALSIVEMSVWNYAKGGSWLATPGVLELTMGGSGTSGMLRYQSASGDERFTVAVGVHNYAPWVHIIPDVPTDETAVTLLPQYYNGGKYAGIPVVPTAEVQTSTGRKISAVMKNIEGNSYVLQLNIA
ncbi:fruit body lectin [Xylaria sp. CBS 124048]|nr:fruit body lectin [Xylaria sp. CBS 124048]